ncbi:MAG: hypothetical protein IT581_02190 [Verrucomicrobiales bacterium]|nr:hypothetical protein [Verrucomicrobiales bacterium]
MNRMTQLDPASTTDQTQPLHDGAKATLGVVPTLPENDLNHVTRTIEDSPAVKSESTTIAGQTCHIAGCGCGH